MKKKLTGLAQFIELTKKDMLEINGGDYGGYGSGLTQNSANTKVDTYSQTSPSPVQDVATDNQTDWSWVQDK
ncbi:hypothetical protein [Flavobacterium sp. UBA6046]|jgi:hypothetical protein|uniref:hypothetical protein n=1 Tax=Flavobacterium sp. UBA6046 TaxID=1946552 RepID=UPI0025C40D1D|nr:hypothetical protein [Flavobacterium sp. UBA6046]